MSGSSEQSSSPDRKTIEINDLADLDVDAEAADSVRGGGTLDPCVRPVRPIQMAEPCVRPISTTRLSGG